MAMPKHRRAYTMMELAIVLMILGVLVGIAAPKLLGSADNAAVEATILHLKTIVAAVEAYHNDHGEWPPDGFPRNPPSELEPYLRPNLLWMDCPIGGVYDYDLDDLTFEVTCAISIHDAGATDKLAEIDAKIDDGDSETGWVRYDVPQARLMVVIEP